MQLTPRRRRTSRDLGSYLGATGTEDGMPRPKSPCGTEAAYRRHLRLAEPVDRECRDAHAATSRIERRSPRAAMWASTMACARCGTRRASGRGSLPEGEYVCLACRRRARAGDAPPLSVCRHDGCTRTAHARSLCGTHYETERLGVIKPGQRPCADCDQAFQPRDSKQRFCSPRCSNHFRDSRRQRGHRKHFDAVWVRDRGVCGICGRDIDPSLKMPHRFSATLDHIVPRAHGGADNPSNLRLAHLTCNAARQDRAA